MSVQKKEDAGAAAPGNAPELLAALRHAGLRLTRARREAVRLLCASSRPLTIQQLHQAVSRALPCDLSTLYRFVNDLVGHRLVRAVHLPGRTVPAYVAQPPEVSQDLVTCEGCGSVTFLKTPPELVELERRLAEELHFRGLRHQLGLSGYCEPCSGKGTPLPPAATPRRSARKPGGRKAVAA